MDNGLEKKRERRRLIVLTILSIVALIVLFFDRKTHSLLLPEWAVWTIFITLLLGLVAAFYKREAHRDRQLAQSYRLLEEYRRLVDESAYVSKTDLQGVITYANDRFCEISGYSRRELIGLPHSVVRHPDMPAEVFRQMWETLQSGRIWRGTIKNRSKQGGVYYVDSVIAPILDEAGSPVEYIALRYDVTALEEALLSAKEAKETKDRFLANMSHEIRTPLNAILGFVELLQERVQDAEGKRYVQTIGRNGQTLLGIINDVLDFAKIESGKVEYELLPCNLRAEVDNVVELFRANAEAKALRLDEVWCEPFPECVVTDPLRLRQILGNLLSNAIKFTPPGKRVTVRATYKNESETVEFAVVDEGIGIEPQWQARIFEAFAQVRATDATLHGGTGLGLSISLALAKRLGGDLTLESAVGKGTTFYLQIPAKTCQAKKPSEPKTQTLFEGRSRRILVAEDQADNQLLIRLLLEKMDFLVQIVPDGKEALERFCGEPFDLVLLDENMPILNGTQTLHAIRAWEARWRRSSTPIAVLTANAVKGDRERFLNEGFDDYLSKPIIKKDLIALLERLLTR